MYTKYTINNIPEGHVGVLWTDAKLLEETDHVGIILFVEYHEPWGAAHVRTMYRHSSVTEKQVRLYW